MDELNDYNSSPERSEDRDVICDENDDDSSAEIDLKSDNSTSTSPMIERTPIEINVSGQATHSHSKSSTRSAESMRDFAERCKHIPMRLTEDERRLLSVLENALEVCEYTDTVDVTYSHTGKSKQSRIIASLIDVLSISCGLLVRLFIPSSSVPLLCFWSAFYDLFCTINLRTKIKFCHQCHSLKRIRYFGHEEFFLQWFWCFSEAFVFTDLLLTIETIKKHKLYFDYFHYEN